MSFTHTGTAALLNNLISKQLDLRQFLVLSNDGRLRGTSRNYLVPDVAVIPTDLMRRLMQAQPEGLGIFDEPLPFVAEVWSPSTGGYDVNTKIPVYQRRGDLEIWRIHPFERSVTVWLRHPDNQYSQTIYQSGVVALSALPGVTIDLDALFDFV